MSEHTIIQEHDEYYCTKCRKRWDIHESEPGCVTDKQYRRAKSLDKVRDIKRRYFK